jgi:uncharacterized protein YqeY
VERERPGPGGSSETVRDRLRRALPEAIKARDSVAVSALRSALAAIENAEAVDVARPQRGWSPAPFGSGANEVERRRLTQVEMAGIVRAEAADRRVAAAEYERAGEREHAQRLRAEAEILASHLGSEA